MTATKHGGKEDVPRELRGRSFRRLVKRLFRSWIRVAQCPLCGHLVQEPVN